MLVFTIFTSCEDDGSGGDGDGDFVSLTFATINYSPGGVTGTNCIYYRIINAGDHTDIIDSDSIDENDLIYATAIQTSELPSNNLVNVLVVFDEDGDGIDPGDPCE